MMNVQESPFKSRINTTAHFSFIENDVLGQRNLLMKRDPSVKKRWLIKLCKKVSFQIATIVFINNVR